MIKLDGVKKSFGKKTVLKGIDGELGEGVYGLLGPNGSGKTTLMRCMVGLYRLQGGVIAYDGLDLDKHSEVLNRVGYLPQKFGLFKELKAYNMLEYFATLKNIPKDRQREAIERSAEVVNLSDRLHDRVGSFSGGMIRRMGIAQAILGDPQVILLDEPTAGLDPEERMRFKNIISSIRREKTILISTHIVEDVEALCDHILVMKEGLIAYSGRDSGLREWARDKVFWVCENANLPAASYVEKRSEEGDGVRLRVLSSAPVEGGEPAEPTVEDGYMTIIKEV